MQSIEKTLTLKSGLACQLRSPRKEDAADLLAHMRLTSEETDYMARYPEELDMTVQEEEALLHRILLDEHEGMVAAFVEGKLVGSGGISPVSLRMKLRHRAVFGLSVQRAFWGMGVGSALLADCLQLAERAGYEQVELGVFGDNERAQALYRKFGFEVWGRTVHAYKLKDGSYRDELMMGRQL